MDDRNSEPSHAVLTTRLRLLGFLPLIFFLAHFHHYGRQGGVGHMLWMCNIAALLLGLGILLAVPLMVRVAVIWLIPGLVLWLWFVVLQGGFLVTSLFSHVGGLVVGLVAINRVRTSRWTWLHASLWYLAVQQVCRMVTPPDLNVNVAHRPYEGFGELFASYWQYWLVTTLMVVAGLWALGWAMMKFAPPDRNPS
jgi:hypothetical protein